MKTKKSNKKSFFKEYTQITTFHGYKYLGDDNLHWTERLFFLLICLISSIAFVFLMMASVFDYQNNAISFVVVTDFLDLETKFPSISVCETNNEEKIASVSDSLFGDPHDYTLDEVMKEMLYFRGQSYYTLEICGDQTNSSGCFVANVSNYEKLVRGTCEEILLECKWNDSPFDCCKYFLKMETEIGPCYSINSFQTKPENKSKPFFTMISNKKTGPGHLHLKLKGMLNVYILGPEDVPTISSLNNNILLISPYIHYKRFISITEIENEEQVRSTSIDQRKCRFVDENFLKSYRYYSYSSCTVECRKNAHFEKCGCTHHLMPNDNPMKVCDVKGLKCLHDNYYNIAVLKATWTNKSGLVCECLPSCTEAEINTVREIKEGINDPFAVVDIAFQYLPTERFKRYVVRDKLWLVVSIGGAAALCLGASLLSVFELIYLFFIRFFTQNLLARNNRIYLLK